MNHYDFDQVHDRRNTDSLKWDALLQRFGVTDALPMWVADMDFMSPPEVIAAVEQRAKQGFYGYVIAPDDYKPSVVDWFARRHQWEIDADWCIDSPGVVTALSLAVATYTQPGDQVIIQPPVYPPFYNVVKKNGRELVENPLRLVDGRYQFDLDDLAAKLNPRVKMLILCSPHNPVGRVWERAELEALTELCSRHDILFVSDEIHCDLVFKPIRHTPLATLSPEVADRTITCVAPSKTFNLPGLYTSTVMIQNKTLREQFQAEMIRLSLGHVNVFGSLAANQAYRHGDAWLDDMLTYVHANVTYLTQQLADQLPQVKVIQPEGTYLVWIDCRELGMNGQELSEFLAKDAKLAFNQGYAFGDNGEGFIRINLACPRSIVEEGVRRLVSAVRTRLR